MFYETLGELLGQAGMAIAQPGFADPDDARAEREARQIALLLLRVQAIWPALLPSLMAENGVLRRGLDAANASLHERGLETVSVTEVEDPFALHRDLERGLDRLVDRLAARADQDWASESLAALRVQLVAAAEIQGRLVDEMLSVRLPGASRPT